jgi:Cleft lip and palate transmembrane protein 1 (CLPTM1)
VLLPNVVLWAHIARRICAALIEHKEQKSVEVKNLLGGVKPSSDSQEKSSSVDSSSSRASNALEDDEVKVAPAAAASTKAPKPLVPQFKPNVTVCMVNEFSSMPVNKLQPQLRDGMDIDYRSGTYQPIVHLSEFWLLRVRLCLTANTCALTAIVLLCLVALGKRHVVSAVRFVLVRALAKLCAQA